MSTYEIIQLMIHTGRNTVKISDTTEGSVTTVTRRTEGVEQVFTVTKQGPESGRTEYRFS